MPKTLSTPIDILVITLKIDFDTPLIIPMVPTSP